MPTPSFRSRFLFYLGLLLTRTIATVIPGVAVGLLTWLGLLLGLAPVPASAVAACVVVALLQVGIWAVPRLLPLLSRDADDVGGES